MPLSAQESTRFEAKVSYEPTSGCWLWSGCLNRLGYGLFRLDQARLAHRVAWEMANGPIPKGMVLDHKCHNTACVNPDHLRLASQLQNVQNSNRPSRNTSGLKGVSWDKVNKKWRVAIKVVGKSFFLGRFSSKELAHEAYCQAASKYFGEFANFGHDLSTADKLKAITAEKVAQVCRAGRGQGGVVCL